MKTGSVALFQKYCETAIGKLTEECIENFKATRDEESRIKLMYDVAQKIPLELSLANGKSLEMAKRCKEKGNSFFAKKDHQNALKTYNEGLIQCPQDTDEARELLAILISNRSATYFELKQYKRVFNDLDYLMEVGSYPNHLQYKIWLRKAKCYDALQNERLADEAYGSAVKSLDHSKLAEKAKAAKLQEIRDAMQNRKTESAKLEIVPAAALEAFVGGDEYVSAHPKITFQTDMYQGRYARAMEDIPAGTIILEENPHGSVLDSDHSLSNCQYCFVSVDQPIACSSCGFVVFCSTNCQRIAVKSFHGVECGIQQAILESGASVNCSLSLRLISQRHVNYFKDKRNKLKDYLRDGCKKTIVKKKVYKPDDYDNVFFLCRNEHMRKKEDLIHYSCMAIYLLRLLKSSEYFGESFSDEILTEDELFVGGLILRHLQLLQFNAHEISELRNSKESASTNSTAANYENATIGAGLYPTLALFNHSCDPNIVRYNVKNTMIVRLVKPIKADDIIYENYGPLYMSMETEKRQQQLQDNYWFECLCQACVEMWPLFDEMNQNELRIPCKTDRCPFVFTVRYDDDPFLICDYCNNTTGIFTNLKGLMTLDDILPEAENLFTSGNLKGAMDKFVQGLTVLFKYSRPPHPEIIKVQQRLRTCMVHFGNKACDYKMIL